MNFIWVWNKFQGHNGLTEYRIIIYLAYAVMDKFQPEGRRWKMGKYIKRWANSSPKDAYKKEQGN